MPVLTRAVPVAVLLLMLSSTAAYPASLDRTEPIAQVYEVQGDATVKGSADSRAMLVKKGCLLGPDDFLTLDKNASVSMYFKNGGRKEVRAKDAQTVYKVADLQPGAQAYSQSVPLFGATRGIDIPEAASQPSGFFYPQEAVILDSAPSIEFTLFKGPGDEVAIGRATVQIVKGSEVLESRSFDSLVSGTSCVYQPSRLSSQIEYMVELRLELAKSLGSVVSISFPMYISGISDAGSASKQAPFSDAVYRSVESTSIDHKGKRRTITAIKQISKKGASSVPVIAIELFIS